MDGADHGTTALCNLLDHTNDDHCGAAIQSAGGFIEEQESRISGQLHSDRESLEFPWRQSFHVCISDDSICESSQFEISENLCDESFALFRSDIGRQSK